MKKAEDKKRAVAKEKRWATLAKQESKGNAKAAKREEKAHMPISAAESRKEAKMDMQWAKKRRKIAKKIERE